MLQEIEPLPLPGLVKFDSILDLRHYLKNLMTQYEIESDRYGGKVGRLMRILEMENAGKKPKKLREVEWKRTGMIMLNTKEPKRGTLELMIEVMEDYRFKARRTGEVLANISALDEKGVPVGGSVLVYLRHGVPLRIVIDNGTTSEVDFVLAPHPSSRVADLIPSSRA
jgi:hypothetical protein